MKKIFLLLFVLLCIAFCLGNTSDVITLELSIDGQIAQQEELRVATIGSLILNGIYGGDLDKMAKSCGSKLRALEMLSPTIIDNILTCAQQHTDKPLDAQVSWDGSAWQFAKEKHGVFVDIDDMIDSAKYSNGRLCASGTKSPIDACLTLAEVSTWTTKIASFSTTYHTSSDARRHNIALAANALDGYVLKRGGKLSFNAVVGARTEERGYKNANVILHGEFVKGVGGGVCQVSTTLYNLALKSGLDVVMSACHSLPVSYVDLGLDAMVSASSDLVIANNTAADVYLSVRAVDGVLTMTAFSKSTESNCNIKIYSVVDKRIEASYNTHLVDKVDKDGQAYHAIVKEKQDGAIVASYLEYYSCGKKVRKNLRTSYYKASDGIIEKTNPAYLDSLLGSTETG